MNHLQEVFIMYHVDPDGFCSGAIAKTVYPKAYLLPFLNEPNYYFLDRVPDGSKLLILDCSMPVMVMKKLLKRNMEILWIDHHASAFKEYEGVELGSNCTKVLVDGTAACELTWNYFYPNKPLPKAVRLIADHDVWTQRDWETVEVFSVYAHNTETIRLTEPNMVHWKNLLGFGSMDADIFVEIILKEFKPMYDFQKSQNTISAKSICYDAFIKDYKCIVANRSQIGSEFFESVKRPDHDIMVGFCIAKDGLVKYSLRTERDDIDLSVLCKELTDGVPGWNGGGHPKSGGLRCNVVLLPKANLQDLINASKTQKGIPI